VLGNAAFLADHPHFVGHARLVQAMVRSRGFFVQNYGGDFDAPPSAAQVVGPDRLVVDTLVLDLGRRQLRLRAWPSAHSDCDVSVFDPRSGVLWTGDLLFRGRLPALDGNLKGWLGAIETLARTPATLVVPGHGDLTTDLGGALARERSYLRALYQGVRAELAEGQSVEDATRKVALAERPKWSLWDEVHPRNVARAYEELQWE
jgi:glyoxylase-like metal-dependent hydrolase (beta-lactamase superfamily II)